MVTSSRVPMLEEMPERGRGKILFNIDKAWGIREDVYRVASEMGVTDQMIFKGSAEASEVNEFRLAHPDVLYCHLLDDGNYTQAHSCTVEPDCYEIVWDAKSDAQTQPEFVAGLNETSRVFVNTM